MVDKCTYFSLAMRALLAYVFLSSGKWLASHTYRLRCRGLEVEMTFLLHPSRPTEMDVALGLPAVLFHLSDAVRPVSAEAMSAFL